MDKKKFSAVGDLSGLSNDIKKVFEKHGFNDPALGIAFTLPENRQMIHFVTNVHRQECAIMFYSAAGQMIVKKN